MNDKNIDGLSQDEWCEYVEILGEILNDDQDEDNGDYDELSQY